MSKHQGKAIDVVKPKPAVRYQYGRAPWTVKDPGIKTDKTITTICPSPAHFGPAAKLASESPVDRMLGSMMASIAGEA